MAFLLDRLADAVLAGVPAPDGDGPQQRGRAGTGDSAGGGERSAPLPQPLAKWLSDRALVREGSSQCWRLGHAFDRL
jgi:hypothetical protein